MLRAETCDRTWRRGSFVRRTIPVEAFAGQTPRPLGLSYRHTSCTIQYTWISYCFAARSSSTSTPARKAFISFRATRRCAKRATRRWKRPRPRWRRWSVREIRKYFFPGSMSPGRRRAFPQISLYPACPRLLRSINKQITSQCTQFRRDVYNITVALGRTRVLYIITVCRFLDKMTSLYVLSRSAARKRLLFYIFFCRRRYSVNTHNLFNSVERVQRFNFVFYNLQYLHKNTTIYLNWLE